MPAVVKVETCSGCGDCVEICPCGAIEVKNEKAVVDPELCANCGACVAGCPTESISME